MTNRYHDVIDRAQSIKKYKTLEQAVKQGAVEQYQDISVSEALILGLLNQGVRKFIGIFGHGSTDIANILSYYEDAGLAAMYNVRHEVEAAHCVTMLKWHYGETAAVVTSIGPGALHAFAGSLVAASNGIGVYHIYGDETTHDEGFNMQQIPRERQAGFLKLAETMSEGYQLHTPEAVFTALRRGASTVFSPVFPSPFYFLAPMNIQPEIIKGCNLLELPKRPDYITGETTEPSIYIKATELVSQSTAIAIKIGGGAYDCGEEIIELAERINAVIVSGAKTSGVVPYSHPRFMSVGGSKGSICGNFAMNTADLIIAIGARAVCQWDCSGTAWKNATCIINMNTDHSHASHYNNSLPIVGDAKKNLKHWITYLKKEGVCKSGNQSQWLKICSEKKKEWEHFKNLRYSNPTLYSYGWNREVLTQPSAIKIAYDFAENVRAARYFDAGDVQANGFQVVEDEEQGRTFTDTGASYMGFASSALLASGIADKPVYTFAFSGDGSFTMNPQILFDGIEHKVNGCVIVFDNRSMAAITALQEAQYQAPYKTTDTVETDYVQLARSIKGVNSIFGGYTKEEFSAALEEAYNYKGLSFIHVPVYFGDDELGGLGVFGSWNVGNWCIDVQKEHHRLGF